MGPCLARLAGKGKAGRGDFDPILIGSAAGQLTYGRKGRSAMEHLIDVPGIRHVQTSIAEGDVCYSLAIYIHHQLPPEEIERIVRAVELLVPSMIRIAATL